MSLSARIGFRMHTGWAVLVAVSEGEEFTVLRRCRIELLPSGWNRFVYHEAAELPLADAATLIESVRHSADETARAAIAGAVGELKITRASLPVGSPFASTDLAAVLRSHAQLHAGEGALYASAVASACENLKIPLITMPERNLWSQTPAERKARIEAVRKTIGPPWTLDHKIATAAALA